MILPVVVSCLPSAIHNRRDCGREWAGGLYRLPVVRDIRFALHPLSARAEPTINRNGQVRKSVEADLHVQLSPLLATRLRRTVRARKLLFGFLCLPCFNFCISSSIAIFTLVQPPKDVTLFGLFTGAQTLII